MSRAELAIPDPQFQSQKARNSRRLPMQGAPEPIAALNRVRILERAKPYAEREPLMDIRLFCPEVRFSEGVCPYLRRTVAEMLNKAQASLPDGYRLKVGTALRTLSMQRAGWDGYFRRMQEAHPEWPLSALRRATNKYHAPYDQPAPPGHGTGGAVDVGLLDPEGNALDMTAPTEGWEAAYTWSDKIDATAKHNRMRMVEAMLGAGFSNCRDEYWHYSYGDSAWAVRVGETECPYGWAYPPVRFESNFEGASGVEGDLETVRDANGRVLSASGSFSLPLSPGEAGSCGSGGRGAREDFRVGLYWAKEIPVVVQISGVVANPTFTVGDNKEGWEPVTNIERDANAVVLRLTPSADRVYLRVQE